MVESTAKKISIAEFISVAVNLAERSGNIIREVYKSGAIGKQEKDNNLGPVTIADLRVQRTIEYNLKHIFPTLEVQGEEDPKEYSHFDPALQPEELIKDLITQDFINPYHQKR